MKNLSIIIASMVLASAAFAADSTATQTIVLAKGLTLTCSNVSSVYGVANGDTTEAPAAKGSLTVNYNGRLYFCSTATK
jgi:hypothetical protein